MFGDHITVWHAFVTAFALSVAVADLKWRRIPRAFTVPALVAGLLFHVVYGGFVSALEAAALGFVIGIILFKVGAIGGGDVKLMSALGAMLGVGGWMFAMEVSVFAAALIGLGQAIRARRLRQTLSNVGDTVRWIAHRGATAHPTINVGNASMLRAPFGVAAAVGTLAAMIKP
ncbi:MAG: A24 family peptidase [Terriglobales bacterium]|jgi:prepilin peptidase CpaA